MDYGAAATLASLVRIMVRNQGAQQQLEGGLARLAVPLQRLLHRLNDNTRRGSRRNIAAHYDLGNDFYGLFLDPTMAYSCGIFERADSSLEEASTAKFDRICRKLGLTPGMQVLEIGTGWGGFAIHAARHYGCHVNFAATLNVSMAWLRGRYFLAMAFGAVGGPLAYYSGAKLGATEVLPTTTGMLLLAIGWGIMTPLLVWLARIFSVGKKTPE